jgi:hypothetical protein
VRLLLLLIAAKMPVRKIRTMRHSLSGRDLLCLASLAGHITLLPPGSAWVRAARYILIPWSMGVKVPPTELSMQPTLLRRLEINFWTVGQTTTTLILVLESWVSNITLLHLPPAVVQMLNQKLWLGRPSTLHKTRLRPRMWLTSSDSYRKLGSAAFEGYNPVGIPPPCLFSLALIAALAIGVNSGGLRAQSLLGDPSHPCSAASLSCGPGRNTKSLPYY